MVRLRPVLYVILAVCLLGLLYVALGLYSPNDWTWSSTVITMRVMKMPVSAESTGAEWQVSFDITLPNIDHWVRVKDIAVRVKEPPVTAESRAAEWLGSIGFYNPMHWLRESMAILNKDTEQSPDGKITKASVLPSCLGHLWEDLAQVDRTWMFHTTCKVLHLLYLAGLPLYLWRNVWRPQGQVSNGDQCHRKRQHWLKKGTITVKARKDCKEKTEPSTGKKASASPEKSSENTSSCRNSQAQQDSSCSLELPTISVCPQVCPCQGSRQMASSSSMAVECVSSNGVFSDCELLRKKEFNYIQLLRRLRNIERIRLKEHRQRYYKHKSRQ